MTDESSQLLIAGAGPAGLSLAITCGRFGLPVRIIDKAPESSRFSKALAIWSGTLEAFSAMGVVDSFVAEGRRLQSVKLGDGRRELGSIPVGEGIDSPYPFPILIPQSRTELLLAERLDSLGTKVERGVELIGIAQDDESAIATMRHRDGREENARFRYVVGCDGARSIVRESLGIEFEGATEEQTFLLCDARIEGPLDSASIYIWWHNGGSVALFPIHDDVWRVFAIRVGSKSDEPPAIDEMQRALDLHGPGNLTLRDSGWLSAFRINERLAGRFRAGRFFLAGDAAHIHSPAGGQGMNTGIQDGVNLGWKLAYALAGVADPELLLESYEAERRPVASDVIKGATQALHFGFGDSVFVRAARDIAVPILSRIPAVRRMLQTQLSETAIVYDDGPLVRLGASENPRRQAGVGRRARDVSLQDPTGGANWSLWPLLCGPCHTLILFEGFIADTRRRDLIDAARDRIRIVPIDASSDPDGEFRSRYEIDEPGWILIRPDQVIAARGLADDTSVFERYIRRVIVRP